MGRPPGTRNPGYLEERARLVEACRVRLSASDGAGVSFRELAAAAGVGIPTLRHYFGTRDGVIEAVLVAASELAEPYLRALGEGALPPLRESLMALLTVLTSGRQRAFVDSVHAIGLTHGLGEERLGPAYLSALLEPPLRTVERILARHIERGELVDEEPRYLALALVAPVYLARWHQRLLGGAALRPLDLEAFAHAHLEAFLRAHARTKPHSPLV